ncbi:uncharacterized protein Tco025E_05734 [Trypanosoma conorhini]|uniref:Uncharacterized protein n=1 Tax=Trypanosoma conorhini TaxID=83891 RepID=A0A422PAC1_9TRYP|nr:uncharacterized protein Tco025E_05734 [Trypanosoma conorhini]RNF14658.1 hypothetical protein Tco025E_05734 [Trypanosoma conorhini]
MQELAASTATPMRWRKTLGTAIIGARHSPVNPITSEATAKRALRTSSLRGSRVRVQSSSSTNAVAASPFRLLEEALWTEVGHLNEATRRLRERLVEVKCEFVVERSAAAMRGESLSAKGRKNGASVYLPRPQPMDDPPYAASFTPSCSHKKPATNVRLRFTSPRKTPPREGDDSVLTSLGTFAYTPQTEDHRGAACVVERENSMGEVKLEPVSEKGTPFHLFSATTMGSPLVVDLQESTHHATTMTPFEPVEPPKEVNLTRKSAKDLLLRANVMAVEEDLEHYVADLRALQRDTLDAQKRGRIDLNEASVRELRLGIRDELNAAHGYISALKSIQLYCLPDELGVGAS